MASTNQYNITNNWQVKLEELFNHIFGESYSWQFAASEMVRIDCNGHPDRQCSCIDLIEIAILNCQDNKVSAMETINASVVKHKVKSIERTLAFLINLRELYWQGYREQNYALSWQGRLDKLFGIYIHQNSLEYAAAYMAENTCGYLDIYHEYVHVLETAITNCKENKTDAMRAINESGGYMPQSIEETLRLLTEFYKLYLQEYEKHTSGISSGVGRV